MEKFNISKAAKAQKDYQKLNNFPDFAPSSGICYCCNKNIYTEIYNGRCKTGISIDKATKELVTGCPHCNRSYCD